MKHFFKFLLIGLIYGGFPEVVNQIYVKHSVSGFFATLRYYLIMLLILFVLRKWYNRIVKNKLVNNLFWYVLLGAFGLYIEWTYLGNQGAAWYGQIAMFTFWGSFGIMPAIFTEEPVFADMKRSIKKYTVVWIAIYLIAGIANPGLGLLLWILGSVLLNYYYFRYFRLLRKSSA